MIYKTKFFLEQKTGLIKRYIHPFISVTKINKLGINHD